MTAVLSVLGYVLLVLLILVFAVLAFALFIPVYAEIFYKEDKAEIFIKYLFIKKRVYPKKSNPKKEKKQQKSQTEQPKKAKNKSDEHFLDRAAVFLTKLAAGTRISKSALSLISVKLRLNMSVAGDDAAECAINVGKYNAFVHSLVGVLANLFKLKKREINIYPDYDGQKNSIDFYLKARLFSVNLVFNLKNIITDLSAFTD